MNEYLKIALEFFASNHGGTLLSLLLIGWLFYRDWKCSDAREADRRYIGKLTYVVVKLHGAVLKVAGRRSVNLEGLDDLLKQDRPDAVRWADYDGPERRNKE